MTVDVFKQALLGVVMIMLLVLCVHAEQTISHNELDNNINYQKTNTLDFSMNSLYLRQNPLQYYPHRYRTFYDWGFDMKAEYLKPNGRFFYSSWYHYNADNPDLRVRVSDFNIEGPIFVDYGYTSKFDVLFIEGGLTFFSSNNIDIDLHGGILLGNMKNIQRFNMVSNQTQSSEITDIDLDYEVIGPAIGINFYYHFNHRFQVYFLSDITMMIRRGDYSVRSTRINLKGTQTAFSDDNLKGSMEGLNLEVGGKYKLPLKHEGFEIQAGWLSLIFNEPELQWGGGFMGARWVGDI